MEMNINLQAWPARPKLGERAHSCSHAFTIYSQLSLSKKMVRLASAARECTERAPVKLARYHKHN